MHLGIKVALGNDSISDLGRTKAEFAEVWYNANKPDEYRDLFSYLHAHVPHSGLHFWGAISTGDLATIAYPDKAVGNESTALIQQTIDTAARNGFSYVNIHPGTRSLVHVDFTTVSFTVKTQPKPLSACEPVFLEHAAMLSAYAKKRGVVLTIESVPPKTANQWRTVNHRNDVLDLGELPLSVVTKAIDQSSWFANDFSHTAANSASDHTSEIWKMLYDVSKRYRTRTKLVHIGFLAPPFNGTDFHDHLDNPLLATSQAVPNTKQLLELLGLYNDLEGVYGLVEPINDHVKNFFLAKELLAKATDR